MTKTQQAIERAKAEARKPYADAIASLTRQQERMIQMLRDCAGMFEDADADPTRRVMARAIRELLGETER